jgi:hypothetical protein
MLNQLDGWIDERLLVADGEAFRFRHPIVREILAGTFSPAARARFVALASVATEAVSRPRQVEGATEISGESTAAESALKAPFLIPAETLGRVKA